MSKFKKIARTGPKKQIVLQCASFLATPCGTHCYNFLTLRHFPQLFSLVFLSWFPKAPTRQPPPVLLQRPGDGESSPRPPALASYSCILRVAARRLFSCPQPPRYRWTTARLFRRQVGPSTTGILCFVWRRSGGRPPFGVDTPEALLVRTSWPSCPTPPGSQASPSASPPRPGLSSRSSPSIAECGLKAPVVDGPKGAGEAEGAIRGGVAAWVERKRRRKMVEERTTWSRRLSTLTWSQRKNLSRVLEIFLS